MDAMKKHVDDEPNMHNSGTKMCRKKEHDAGKRLLLPDRSKTNEQITKYLTGRGISKELIDACAC